MEKIPQIQSISTMKHQYKEVLNQLGAGPIVLTQHGHAVAVLVSPTDWDQAVDERETLKDVIVGLRAELALAQGEDELVEIDPDNFVAEVLGEPLST